MSRSKKNNKLTAIILGAGLGTAGAVLLGRSLTGQVTKFITTRFMTEPYNENLWEAFSAGARITPQVIVETNIRSELGRKISRPFGGPKKFPDFSSIMFNVDQLSTLPTVLEKEIDSSVVLGKLANRPVTLDIPILISGMAYGLALSDKAKVALAKGASMAGTATNTGYGPFLPEERAAAKHLILQYNRGNWSKGPETLKKADLIEIQLGQGATAGTGEKFHRKDLDKKLIRLLGLSPGENAVVHSRMPEINSPRELGNLVNRLRETTDGVPIGVKIAAGNDLEQDMAHIIEAGADFITVDGAQGGSSGAAPILEDDCGLPTIFAVCRAARFLEQQQVRDRISLIISGGLKTPGDYLKAMALGADAVAIGTIALWAMAHTQVFKSLPFEPPVQVVFADGKDKDKLDVDKGARNLASYLLSSVAEMKLATMALGKTALNAVDKNDLFALDESTAKIANIKLAY
ncbi:FMN-binding glutamate synthase family protein [Desulfotruncus alcoholivorax]|uniref:FMN-binding glutamate synthase family protein n=1 Tax=Desulfotruncus alcoholivorax TaxID=265477 RepID=UPI00040B982F|nr:FMN-binding glutamate synthase family protein [Desulfotruncus alcoholivorax]